MHSNKQSGSVVAYILIIAMASLFILSAVLSQVTIAFNDSRERYYQKITDEAAESGIVYAQSCLEQNNRTQTWASTGANVLKPNSPCTGVASGSLSAYVYSDSVARTRFTVGSVTVTPLSANIQSTGYTELLVGGTWTQTYKSVQSRAIIWDPNLVAQSSSSGTSRTCGVLSGNVWCWGVNNYGQLGDGTTTDSSVPVPLVRDPSGIGSRIVKLVTAGNLANCAIVDNGTVWCWGRNHRGQLGNNSITDSSVPVQASLPTNFVASQVAAGANTFCALGNLGSNIGQIYCWGSDSAGVLGDSSGGSSVATGSYATTPRLIAGPGITGGLGGAIGTKSVKSLNYGGAFSSTMCAITTDELVYCWGFNDYGQVGDNTTTSRTVPTAVYTAGVLSGKKILKVTVEGHDTVTGTNDETHTCALAYTTATTDARVYCWGSNDDTSTAGYVEYYLGNGSTAGQSNVPVLSGMTASSDLINSMGSTPIITDIAATAAGACVLAYPSATNAASTRPYCWGHRQTRGDDDPGDSSGIVSTPHARRVTDASTTGIVYNNQATGLVGGAYRACTIVNYRIYCWGANNSGQIGFGSTTPTNVYYPREATYLRPSPARTLF